MHRRVEYGHTGDQCAYMIASAEPSASGMSIYLDTSKEPDPWNPTLIHSEEFIGSQEACVYWMRQAQEFIPATREPLTFVVDWDGGYQHAERTLRRDALLFESEVLSVWPLHDESGTVAVRMVTMSKRYGLMECRIDNHGTIVRSAIAEQDLTTSEQRVYRGWAKGKLDSAPS